MKKSAKKAVEPMDDGIREQAVGVAAPNHQRQCWAIKTLVAEVDHLFPDTPTTYSNYNVRNAALTVTFDLMNVPETEQEFMIDLLRALNSDERVLATEVVGWEVSVTMREHPILMDTRDPFGLPEAWAVLFEDEDSDDVQWVDEAADFPGGSN